MSIDQLLIIGYFVIILIIGFLKKSKSDTNSFLFAGRSLSLPALVATIVSTWYGAILEVGRFTYQNGIVTWFIFSLFYYIAAIIFARFIVPKIIDSNMPTLPDLFLDKYGRKAAIVALICILFMASPAPYLKIFGDLMSFVWNIPTSFSLIIGTILTMSYSSIGGFSSVVRTDKVQFTLMFVGFFILLFSCYSSYGGFDFISVNVPSYAFSIPGNFNWSFIFAWGFISLITIIDPGFYQRTFSGESQRTVQKSLYISIIFWFIFDLMTITAGLYALAIVPENAIGSPYLELSSIVLSPITQGIFMVSLFSIVMSTIDSYSFISAFTIGRDVPRIILDKKNISAKISIRFGLIVTSAIAIIIALYFTYAVDIWYIVGSFTVPALLIPLILALYSIRIHNPFLCMILPSTISILWYIYGLANSIGGYPNYLLNLDPMYPGVISSFILCYLFSKKGVFR